MSKRKLLTSLALASFLTAWTGLGTGLFAGRPLEEAAGPSARRVFSLNGGWARGSVALGDVNRDGLDDIVVGGSDGIVHVYRDDGSSGVRLWQYDTGESAIEGKPAIGDIDGDGWNEVVVGVGSQYTPDKPGGVWAFDHTGTYLWHYASGDFNRDGVADGVYSSPALADVDGNDGGKLEIVYGGWDGYVRVLNDDGTLLWEVFVRDTIWSSPAIGDIDRDDKLEIAIGVDSHYEPAFGTQDGGILYVFNGEDGSVLFRKQIDEVIWSSPALGDLDGDGWMEIVVGTGDCWSSPACAPGGRTHPVTEALYAWDHQGNPVPGWPVPLSEHAFGSPALGDLDDDGDLEVVVNTGDAYVHAFTGGGTPVPGVPGWPRLVTTPAGPGSVLHAATQASPILADATGDGDLEVVLPSNWEIVVWDRNGDQLTRDQWPPASGDWELVTEYSVAGTPAAGDTDGDGRMELIVGGARSGGSPGALYVWDFDDVLADARAPWPSFRRDRLNHGRHTGPARLWVSPSPLYVGHEYGSGSSETRTLRVANAGQGQMEWQVISSPAAVTVDPLSGTAGSAGQAVEVTVNTTGYLTGTHALGDITFAGTVDGEPVLDSPTDTPVILIVGSSTYLPVVLRGSP